MAGKVHLPAFTDDIPPPLPPGLTFDLAEGLERAPKEMIAFVPGEPWKGKARRSKSST